MSTPTQRHTRSQSEISGGAGPQANRRRPVSRGRREPYTGIVLPPFPVASSLTPVPPGLAADGPADMEVDGGQVELED